MVNFTSDPIRCIALRERGRGGSRSERGGAGCGGGGRSTEVELGVEVEAVMCRALELCVEVEAELCVEVEHSCTYTQRDGGQRRGRDAGAGHRRAGRALGCQKRKKKKNVLFKEEPLDARTLGQGTASTRFFLKKCFELFYFFLNQQKTAWVHFYVFVAQTAMRR